MIRVICRKCGKKFGAAPEHSGKRAKCPGCGVVLTIPSPAPGAQPSTRPAAGGRAETVASGPVKKSSLEEFLDEELAQSNRPGASKATCPTCGKTYPDGQDRCGICDRTASPPDLVQDYIALDSNTARRGRLKNARFESFTDNLAKLGTVAFVGGIVLVAWYWLIGTTSDAQVEGVLAVNVSAGQMLNNNARFLELHLPRLPTFVKNLERSVAVTDSPGNGMWGYSIKADHRSWEHIARAESLTKFWMNRLHGMGYFREPSKQPPPIRITEFSIQEPTGRTWHMTRERSTAQNLCNMVVMLGCMKNPGELSLLMSVKRGSLGYAVFFSGINENMPLEEKIAHSCNPIADIRVFSAEMLLSTLSALPMDGDKLDREQYESLLTQLAQAMTVEEKNAVYRQICARADAGEFSSPAVATATRRNTTNP